MPLQLPNLDDRTYDDLVEEALSLIPSYAPNWTNHNPSDPGITLVELFAYLTEILIYRLNRVTDANVISFLQLLNGPEWPRSAVTSDNLTQQIQETIQTLRQRERAVTCADYEELALKADPQQRVARAQCIPRRDLKTGDFERDRPGHLGILIVPKTAHEAELEQMIQTVQTDLETRRLLTTYIHVTKAQYRKLTITTTIVPLPDRQDEVVKDDVRKALIQFLAPLTEEEKPNWPFGRNVFVSEIYQLLDQTAGVDYVTQVDLQTDTANRRILRGQALVGIEIKPYELVAPLVATDITVNLNRTNNQ